MDALTIKKSLNTKLIGNKVYFYKEIDSTNDEAKRLAKLGIGEGAVVLAEAQTRGRGKFARRFHSPGGSGLYLSVIIEPFKTADRALEITLLGTLASARAISALTSQEVRVKWPNDIMMNKKKVGGVLTEICRSKSGRYSIVVGIGINVSTKKEDFPEELRGRATSILEESGKKIGRTTLIRTLLEQFEKLYFLLLSGHDDMMLSEWKILSDTLGERVKIRSGDTLYEGKAVGVGDGGELILKIFGGSIRKFSAGDILIKEGN